MRKVLLTVVVTGLMLMTACTNGDIEIEGDLIEDTDDLQTLIETNELLVQQLASVREENDHLKESIYSLEEKNAMLKENILTYRQDVHEVQNLRNEELALRNELDELAMELFQAMNSQDQRLLENLVDENTITVNGEAGTLEVSHSIGTTMTYTFHFIEFDTLFYIRQVEFNYNPGEKEFTSKYALFSEESKGYVQVGEVILLFTDVGGWKLSSIRNNSLR